MRKKIYVSDVLTQAHSRQHQIFDAWKSMPIWNEILCTNNEFFFLIYPLIHRTKWLKPFCFRKKRKNVWIEIHFPFRLEDVRLEDI